jgi:hypothetical protein
VGTQALSTLAERDIASQKIAADVQKEKRDALVRGILVDERAKTPMSEFQKQSLDLRKKELNLIKDAEERRLDSLSFKKGETDKQRQEKLINSFNKDRIILSSNDALNAGKRAKEMLMRNNPISGQVVKRALARMSGEVGVMTDKDVEDFAGSKAFTDRFKAIVTQATTGKLTPENREFMLQIIEDGAKVENQILEERSKLFGAQFGQVKGQSSEEVESLISPEVPKGKKGLSKLEKIRLRKKEILKKLGR